MARHYYALQAYVISSLLGTAQSGKLDNDQLEVLYSLSNMIFLGLFETFYIGLHGSDILPASKYNVIKSEIRNLIYEQ